MWCPQYLIQTARRAIIDHPCVIYFFYQKEMCKAKDFFFAADVIFLRSFNAFFFPLSAIVGYLALCCDLAKRPPSPVQQG